MKKLHINILFLLIWSFSFAQQYTNYTTKNGLPSNHIYKITQDHKGFIWFITDQGMVKFNGNNFKTFTTKQGLPTNDIWDIRITNDNKVWYFSKAAALGYIENDSVFTFKSNLKDDILYPTIINQSNNEISFYNSFKQYILKNDVWNSKDLKKRNLAYLEEPILHKKTKKIIYKKNSDSFEVVNINNKLLKRINNPIELSGSYYRGQVNDSIYCWVSNDEYHLLNLNTLKTEYNYFNKATKNFKTNFVRFNLANDKIQFSGKDFVSKLNTNYELVSTIKISKKLKSHFSFIDKSENLWIATFSDGVYFLPREKRLAIYSLNGEKTSKLQFVNGKLITNVYDKGFYQYNAKTKKFIPFIPKKGFLFSAIYIDSLKTEFYITNKEILKKINNKQSRSTNGKIEYARDLVYVNRFLYGNYSSGLNKINPKDFKIIKNYNQNGIKSLTKFKNKLIIATSNGLKMLENDTIKKIVTKNKLLSKPISRIKALNNENLVVCTDGYGAYITNLSKVTLLEKSNYLSVKNVFINKNEIWLATNKGALNYYLENGIYRLKNNYTISDGLITNLINAVVVKDNNIITSSNDGISVIPLKKEKSNQFLDLYFNEIKYNNTSINNNGKVKYKANNQFNIAVSTVNFSTGANLDYSYQLLPIQKEWISSNSKKMSFNNLKPLKYVLNIKSKDRINSINFEIKPLWYQTIFAKFLFLLISLGSLIMIALGFRKKELVKQQKKIKAQKKLADFELHALRSQMNPHFVFNSLNAIQYFMTKNEIDLSEKYLVKFARLIRMFFDFSRKKEVALKEEILLLKSYLEIEKMRFGDDFNFKIDIINNLGIESFKIPTMLLQPIVENAVNHGLFHNKGKGLIHLFFTFITKDKLEIVIKDNGVGIKKAKEIMAKSLKQNVNKDNSTNVIKERIELLNQTKVWSINYSIKENNGTVVKLIFTKNE